MKNKLIIAAAVIGLVAITGYFAPIAISAIRSKPLYGCFEMHISCACGHDIFLCLEEDEAFDYIPGHEHKELIGTIERSDDSVIIYDGKINEPWYQLNYDGKGYTLIILNESDKPEIPTRQINNPWKTWLPLLFAE